MEENNSKPKKVDGRKNNGLANRNNIKTQIAMRRAAVATLFLRHTTRHDISKALGVSQSSISCDLKFLREQWMAEALRDIKEHQARFIAELDSITSECTAHLHNKDRDRSQDSVWITQWRVTLLERAKVLGLLDSKSSIDITSGGRAINVREVIVELPAGSQEV